MKYLCLAYESEKVLNSLSEADWQALRQETLDYVEKLRADGKLLDTSPLQSTRKAAALRVHGGQLSVTDGPLAETKEQIGGYFLLRPKILMRRCGPLGNIGEMEETKGIGTKELDSQ